MHTVITRKLSSSWFQITISSCCCSANVTNVFFHFYYTGGWRKANLKTKLYQHFTSDFTQSSLIQNKVLLTFIQIRAHSMNECIHLKLIQLLSHQIITFLKITWLASQILNLLSLPSHSFPLLVGTGFSHFLTDTIIPFGW